MPLIIKSMSLPDVAAVNVFLSSVVLLSSIVTLGMDAASTHLVRNENETTGKIIFSNGFFTILATAILALPIAALFGLFFITYINQQGNTSILIFLCLWTLSATINQFNLNWIKYSFNQKAFLKIILTQSLTYLFFIFFLYYKDSISLENFLIVMTASNLLPSILGVIINRKMLTAKINIKTITRMVKYGVPFMLMAFGFNFIFSSDRYFLVGNISIEDLAIYTQNFRIASIFSMIVSSFNFAFTPYALSILDNKDSENKLSKIRSNYIFILTSLGLLFIASSKIFIALLAGEIFLAGAKLIPFFIFSYIAYGLYSFSQLGIIKSQKSHYTLYVLLAGLVANIVMNLLLISFLGIYGAAISFLASIVLMNVVANVCTRNELLILKTSIPDIILGITLIILGLLLSFYSISQSIYIDASIKTLGIILLCLMCLPKINLFNFKLKNPIL
jgi:O-antigen/teichoic acid export membrane protein